MNILVEASGSIISSLDIESKYIEPDVGQPTNLKIEREKTRRAIELDLAASQLQHLQPTGAEQLAQPLHQLTLVRQGEVEGPSR